MLDTSDHAFRLAVGCSSSWKECALARLNPEIASRIAAVFDTTRREPTDTNLDWHRRMLATIGDPEVAPFYKLGVAFDEAVSEEWPMEDLGYDSGEPVDLSAIPSDAFPRSRAIFDAIAALTEGTASPLPRSL